MTHVQEQELGGCHCEEAAAAADEAIPKLGFGDRFAEFTLSGAKVLAMTV
jgi:hypothetical protein